MMFFERLNRLNAQIRVQLNVPLSRYTTLRVGGPADYFVEIEDEKGLMDVLRAGKETGEDVLLLGNGSNLLVRDGGFRGVAVHFGRAFSKVERQGDHLYAQAGALLSGLSVRARDEGLSGLEFAQGIPGTVGGGAYMNAGAYGGELGALIKTVRIWDGREIRQIPGEQMDFSYRHTRAMDERWIILGALFALQAGDPRAIDAAMRDYAARRRDKQPLEYPSAGSFFKRPAGHFAGALIEQAGLKGLTVGGAQVSEKHAGFLINVGNAKAADFLLLMEQVRQAVYERFQVRLEPEVRIVGSDA
ncbi:MAG: UDP-N-acetylmuramate dehydrogenase [Clostridia bacterium]|nr:UDP-N-acetylmuramate dehydrogenase [Clostridia bacterium]